ncbi:MAG: phosphate ABC transporter permease PstA [Gammaproteobacteria bacterium]|nr:phosphate ABC transporter permease PstA [Gammaproteobacteria bacterium]
MATSSTGSTLKGWANSGSPWVWLAAGSVSLSLVMVFGLLLLIAARGLGQFWPGEIWRFELAPTAQGPGVPLLGEIAEEETVSATRARAAGEVIPENLTEVRRLLIKAGNRDLTGFDFKWLGVPQIVATTQPADALVVEREEWGNLYGFLADVRENGKSVAQGAQLWPELAARLERKRGLRAEIKHIEKDVIGGINYGIERLRLKQHKLELDGRADAAAVATLHARKLELEQEYTKANEHLAKLNQEIARDTLLFRTAGGEEKEIPFAKLVRVAQPNAMNIPQKIVHYCSKLREFLFDEPREANTEGGVFPAIFGTVLMVIIMSLFATPFGVIAAIYLREYATQGPLTGAIRIAVNNLAGVPSVVYGVFGLGFFVYFVGGSIDALLFPERLPAPTFGTPGLLWSSLTLSILTVPVVIVATEEGLARIPRAIREGSLALGATKAETLWRIVLPMATPAMMTGLILAVARAAGEVAPLMMVGVVKLAPSLPLDGNFPYVHLDRKFMHLGFHIYDVGFQSPNVEAARPLVYATALLLVAIIMALNLAAISIRNRLREKYNAADH